MIRTWMLIALVAALAASAGPCGGQDRKGAAGRRSAERPAAADASDKVWGLLGEEESAAAVEELKQFARDAQQRIGHKGLASFETDYFLFVTDLESAEARRWTALLDRMHRRLLEVFDIPSATNVWHGKALVFVFRERADFVKYETIVEEYEAGASVAGVCHQAGPVVRIAFYRQPDDVRFAHVLVHEASHGFIHRYRKPERIISWINEGLAEWIAYDVTRGRPDPDQIVAMKEQLSRRGDTGGMFGTAKIEPWQYPVAHTLTTFMIQQNRRGYVAFIKAIKDGKDWPAAMAEDYGAPLERLVAAYGQSLRLAKPLKP